MSAQMYFHTVIIAFFSSKRKQFNLVIRTPGKSGFFFTLVCLQTEWWILMTHRFLPLIRTYQFIIIQFTTIFSNISRISPICGDSLMERVELFLWVLITCFLINNNFSGSQWSSVDFRMTCLLHLQSKKGPFPITVHPYCSCRAKQVWFKANISGSEMLFFPQWQYTLWVCDSNI